MQPLAILISLHTSATTRNIAEYTLPLMQGNKQPDDNTTQRKQGEQVADKPERQHGRMPDTSQDRATMHSHPQQQPTDKHGKKADEHTPCHM
jgi:hypothetical protein